MTVSVSVVPERVTVSVSVEADPESVTVCSWPAIVTVEMALVLVLV